MQKKMVAQLQRHTSCVTARRGRAGLRNAIGIAPTGLDSYTLAMIETTTIQCPNCGESVSIEVDPTGGTEQEFETDCEVCCRPIVCAMQVKDGDSVTMVTHTESEL